MAKKKPATTAKKKAPAKKTKPEATGRPPGRPARPLPTETGSVIRDAVAGAMEALGLHIAELAAEADLQRGVLYGLLYHNSNPSIENLEKIFKALGLKLS